MPRRARRPPHSFWRGKKILVTAGPTREPLDPVRFIANASSGRMGYALAEEGRRLGGNVTLVSGPVALRPPRGVKTLRVTTARDMLKAVLREARKADAVIGAAAVADWRPIRAARRKLKKSAEPFRTLRLTRNPDILGTLARRRVNGRPRLAGFALETENLRANARKKLHQKSLDIIVANGPSSLDRPGTRAILLGRSGRSLVFSGGSKKALARVFFSFFARERQG
jgi:phosphopantothenoylcysteine decarboxylase / phosphopantothenate---cysteine ligase